MCLRFNCSFRYIDPYLKSADMNIMNIMSRSRAFMPYAFSITCQSASETLVLLVCRHSGSVGRQRVSR